MGYIGKEHDHESGYLNLGVRLYEPSRGLFAAPDPLWSAQLGNSAYHYGYNSPLMYSDPTGLLAGGGGNMTALDVFGGGDRESGWSNYDMMRLYWYFYDCGQTEEAQRIVSTAKEYNRNMGYLGSIVNPVLMDPVHVTAHISVPLCLATLYWHFQFGGGDFMLIAMSSIDLTSTSQRELGIADMTVGDVKPVNLFRAGALNQTALALGRVSMQYQGNDQFSFVRDESSRFDFDPLIDKKASFGRNAGNLLGAAICYNLWLGPVGMAIPLIFSGPFNVGFIGTTYIPK